MAKKIQKTERDVVAANNRAKYPEVAAAIDRVREVFPGAVVVRVIPPPKDQATP